MQLEPEGASHPCEPGWMSVWASTPDRTTHDQPGRRLGGVDVRRVVEEVAVEGVDVLVVGPQRPQRLGDLPEAVGVGLARGRPRLPAAVRRVLRVVERVLVGVGVHQPARPRRDVRRQRDAHQRDERRRPVEDDRAEQRPALAERPPRAGAPQPGEQAEDGQRVDRGPLRAAREPEADPAEDQPGSPPRTCRAGGQPVAQPLTVGDHAVHAAEGEERQEDVEQREPRQHELEAVDGEQEAGDEPEDGRAGDAPGEAAHQQDHQRAHHRRRRAPAGGVHPEDLDPGGDHPLADLGVDDHRRTVQEQPGEVAVEDRLVGVLDVACARSRG